MRAPLTATFLAVELTGDLAASLPLLVACGMAHATTVLLLKRSILTERSPVAVSISRANTSLIRSISLGCRT